MQQYTSQEPRTRVTSIQSLPESKIRFSSRLAHHFPALLNPARVLLLYLLLGTILMSCKPADRSSKDRYVVLSPEVAEILAAIGGADRIVGITDECTYPAELQSIPSVGKFGALNKEKIYALKPSVIFSTGLEQDAIASEFAKLGYKVETIYPKSLAGMISEIRHVGDITGLQAGAKALADSMQTAIQTARQSSAGNARPKVYIEIYRDPLMSVSDQSFVGELIEAAGGDNIFGTLERDYARVKPEDVVAANPDIIICYSQDTLPNMLSRKGWQRIPAIRNRRVYFEADINPDLIQRAGPRSIMGIKQLQQIFAELRTATHE
ncbi:MAG: cobalamin-binding protein [Candidatus Cloacimonetes bacterium HGW-Cloacimonetes-1]|jgi:iron complex transport system substrate-binding protein|nr:MAG: cobalamin-binding protein [Candidatus Cloacimonetes bacterium HGW-Cloacimonetes-1]